MIEFVDTHCHIHFPDYELDPDETIKSAVIDGVTRLLCVGCTVPDSKLAVQMAQRHNNVWASIGLHPHEGSVYVNDHVAMQQFHDLASNPSVVAIGETGLDYYYMHSAKKDQEKLLRFQIDIAIENNKPLIFHVRDSQKQDNHDNGQAFADFFRIFDEYAKEGHKLTGVVHSFSAGPNELNGILKRGLYVGVNGIVTFAKDSHQLEAVKQIPLDRLLLETDSPFLTPVPFRGKVCEPKYVKVVAEFLASLRGETPGRLASATTQNAVKLFGLE